MVELKIGDVVKLKKKYHGNGECAIILSVQKCESFGNGGWITFDYKVMTSMGNICHINYACVEKKVSSLY